MLLLLLLSCFSCVRLLCDPIDSSPPGSSVPGILQARTLEWVVISFSIINHTSIKKKLKQDPFYLLFCQRLLSSVWYWGGSRGLDTQLEEVSSSESNLINIKFLSNLHLHPTGIYPIAILQKYTKTHLKVKIFITAFLINWK